MPSETLFFSLPRITQKRIDSAFNSVAENHTTKPSDQVAAAPGGFTVESGGFMRDHEVDQHGADFLESGGFLRDHDGDFTSGGFLLDDVDQPPSDGLTHIPLSLIPTALQSLGLAPDDEEVLAVFRNAATGWVSSSNDINHSSESQGENQHVSREDWRSVCSVLLEHDSGESGAFDEDIEMIDPGAGSDDAADSDEYQESEAHEEEIDLDDDDEYMDRPSASTARRRTRKSAQISSSPSPSPSSTSRGMRPHKLTSRQHQTCIDVYALFFPTASSEELSSQRIMIKDIQRVAKLLNEKLKTEDMMEMLETFSTSPDKSMSFDDFCRMMTRAKLI